MRVRARSMSTGVMRARERYRNHRTHAGRLRPGLGVFGLWRVCFPPCLVRPGRRLPVQGLSEGSLGFRMYVFITVGPMKKL